VLRLVLVAPGEEVLPGLDLQVALDRAPEPVGLEPLACPVVEDGVRAGDVGQGRGAHHAARDHERRVRPLPAEDRVDLDRQLRERDALLVAGADVGCEAARRLLVARCAGVLRRGEVGAHDRVEVARDALERLGDLPEVAHPRRVRRHVGAPGGVERVARLVEVAAPADAADARRHDEAGLGVLAPQDDLEAAEHRRFGPGVGDDAVGDSHAHVEVAFDLPERADVEVHRGHVGSSPGKSARAGQTTNMSFLDQSGATARDRLARAM